MRKRAIWTGLTLAFSVLCGVLLYSWVADGSFRVCVPEKLTDEVTKTIEGLDKVIDVGLTLSTSLVGLGAALLIGLKSGMRMSLPNQIIVLIAMLFFLQSALYAIWWRLGVVEIRLNQCFQLINQDILERKFAAHFAFFVLGLISLGALVMSAVITGPEPKREDNI